MTRLVSGTTARTKIRPTILGKGKPTWIGVAYEGFKTASKSLGFYRDIEPYLPDTYIDKYRYKPQKRISGYIGKKIHKSKTKTRHHKFRKTCSEFHRWNNFDKYNNRPC